MTGSEKCKTKKYSCHFMELYPYLKNETIAGSPENTCFVLVGPASELNLIVTKTFSIRLVSSVYVKLI